MTTPPITSPATSPAPPTTMRAAHLTGNGGPEMLVVTDDAPVPEPGPSDVLIEVAACGVNNTDVNTRVGWYSESVTEATSGNGFGEARTDAATWGQGGLAFPRIQGADVSGRVVAVGSDAPAELLGARVLVDPWLRDPNRPHDRNAAGYLGSEHDGGFAEYCCVPAINVHPIETELSDIELATIACSWSTAQHMLDRIRVNHDDILVVPGASGGVGSALVQLGRLRGARVIAVASSAKADRVADLGAHAVVARESADVPTAARDAAGGRVTAVADVVGGADVGGWLESLDRGGRYVTSGAIAGPIVDIDLRTLYLNDLELQGATIFGPETFASLVATIEAGDIRPVVAGTFPLGEIHAAQAAFVDKDHVGSFVITL